MKNAFQKIFAIVHRCLARSLPPTRSISRAGGLAGFPSAGALDDGIRSRNGLTTYRKKLAVIQYTA